MIYTLFLKGSIAGHIHVAFATPSTFYSAHTFLRCFCLAATSGPSPLNGSTFYEVHNLLY